MKTITERECGIPAFHILLISLDVGLGWECPVVDRMLLHLLLIFTVWLSYDDREQDWCNDWKEKQTTADLFNHLDWRLYC